MSLELLVARTKLVAPIYRSPQRRMRPLSRADPRVRHAVERDQPDLEPYEHLARIWDRYAASFCPDYGAYVRALESHLKRPFRRGLDLACGTGRVTRQLAADHRQLVGVDRSRAMLREAQSLSPMIEFRHGDYRELEQDLGGPFDVVTCASDSLNYVTHPEQLQLVFGAVARHAHPDVRFIFDVLNDQAFGASPSVMTVEIDGVRCEFVFRYDPRARVAESRIVSGEAVERHRRVPIETEDVEEAARRTGWIVDEHFSTAAFGLDDGGAREFFVLRRRQRGFRSVHRPFGPL